MFIIIINHSNVLKTSRKNKTKQQPFFSGKKNTKFTKKYNCTVVSQTYSLYPPPPPHIYLCTHVQKRGYTKKMHRHSKAQKLSNQTNKQTNRKTFSSDREEANVIIIPVVQGAFNCIDAPLYDGGGAAISNNSV